MQYLTRLPVINSEGWEKTPMEKDARSGLYGFFAEEGKKLRRYVQRRIRSIGEMDAEDIVSEVMLSVFVRTDVSGPIDSLAAYVYRSLHNKVVDYLREGSRTVSLEKTLDDDGELSMIGLLYDKAADVGSEADQHELKARLAKAIGMLEPKQRAVFVATELEGYSFKELSRRWNEPVGTLLSRKCRAVKSLQTMLRDLR
jgi:RNA polymerase sigma factor (sigma-70 family)